MDIDSLKVMRADMVTKGRIRIEKWAFSIQVRDIFLSLSVNNITCLHLLHVDKKQIRIRVK